MPSSKPRTVPLKHATATDALVACDWVLETTQAEAEVAAELAAGSGRCRVAYLRWCPAEVVAALAQRLPTAKVRWTFEIVRRGRQARPQVAMKTCFPLPYLREVMAFLRPSGRQHVAEVSRAVRLGETTDLDLPEGGEASRPDLSPSAEPPAGNGQGSLP